MTQTYLYSLFTFPLAIVTSLFSFIPCIGSLVSLAVAIYELYLAYYMLQPAHRMSADNARAVVLVSLLIGIVLGVVFFFWLFNLLFSVRITHIMSEAASGLGL